MSGPAWRAGSVPAALASGEPLPRRTATGFAYEVATVDPTLAPALPQTRQPIDRLMAAETLGRLHGLWGPPEGEHARAALPLLKASTGFAEPTLREHLAHLFGRMSAVHLAAWLPAEQPDVRVTGPGLAVVLAGGSIPGTALPTVITLLLLGSTVVVKLPREEPVLASLYACTLHALCPELGSRLIVTHWDRAERSWLEAADLVVLYGGDEAARAVRAAVPPATRLLVYGHRVSHCFVDMEGAAATDVEAWGRAVALDHACFDQAGCLSPQAVFVRPGDPDGTEALAGAIAVALAELQQSRPRRPLPAGSSARIHQYRAAAEMRGCRVLASPSGTDWTVVVDDAASPATGPGNRTVLLHPVEDLSRVREYVAPVARHLLSLTLACRPETRAAWTEEFLSLGYLRLAPAGCAQFPDRLELHDGIHGPAALGVWRSLESG